MHLTEWQSEIQAARDHQLIVRPRYPCLGAHAVLLTQSLTLSGYAQAMRLTLADLDYIAEELR
jgi:hypothetical protein